MKLIKKASLYLSRRLNRSFIFVLQRLLMVNHDSPWPVHPTSRVICPNNIHIHKSSIKSLRKSICLYIQAYNRIDIGANVLIGPRVSLISANHELHPEKRHENHRESPISIGDNVWIGANAVILPSVSIGNNSIIGAGSIVTKSFPSNVIIAGNPAKIIKQIPNCHT